MQQSRVKSAFLLFQLVVVVVVVDESRVIFILLLPIQLVVVEIVVGRRGFEKVGDGAR